MLAQEIIPSIHRSLNWGRLPPSANRKKKCVRPPLATSVASWFGEPPLFICLYASVTTFRRSAPTYRHTAVLLRCCNYPDISESFQAARVSPAIEAEWEHLSMRVRHKSCATSISRAYPRTTPRERTAPTTALPSNLCKCWRKRQL